MSFKKEDQTDDQNKPQNKSSVPGLVSDIWLNKQILWNSFYKMIAFTLPTFLFVFKSRRLRKIMVKRHLVKQKNMNFSRKTNLTLILRPEIFQRWDKIFLSEKSPQQILLVEGYQGTGKTFFSKMYLEKQSRIRPTLYISLRDFTAENWKAEMARQINFYAEPFIRSGGK